MPYPILGGLPGHPHLGGGWANLPTPIISERKCAVGAIFVIKHAVEHKFLE